MSKLVMLRLGLVLLATLLAVAEAKALDRWLGEGRLSRLALGLLAIANILFVVFLWFDHIRFPLHLDLMEGTILQHVDRAASLQPVYSAPTAEFVPLAYNPLYYFWCIPFTWIFGLNLFSLRLVAILGMLGSGGAIFVTVRQKTRSLWWSFMAVGLFAAAYGVMDTYLDNAHSDSWFLCTALWGTYLLDQSRSRLTSLGGILLLITSFWFKQHGAVFAIGGLVYLTWREGARRSLLYWGVALVAGPLAYIWLGPRVFGPYFHYFTWEVPRHWTTLNLQTLERYLGFIFETYPVLAVVGGLLVLFALWQEGRNTGAWVVQLVFAAATGFMGALDADSADNVFIAMGTWFILIGIVALHRLSSSGDHSFRRRCARLGLLVSFALLVYDPRRALVSREAQPAYADLLSYLTSLHGNVYAPTIGQLENGYTLYPSAHWAPLEDMVRGLGREVRNQPQIRRLLEPCLRPNGPAYLLTNKPLNKFPVIDFLAESYVLETDLRSRFEPLRVLPKRFDHAWPRYLYRYQPNRNRSARLSHPLPRLEDRQSRDSGSAKDYSAVRAFADK